MQASDQPGPTTERGRQDTSAIDQLIARARRRIRLQWALEGATTATVLAAAAALAAIFAIRVELVERTTGFALIGGAAAIIVIGAVLSAMRRLDDERVARRVDRASNLADRLSTAVAFNRTAVPADGDPTHELMVAAIRDGVRAAPRADIKRATPFTAPHDLRAAAGFLVISALAAGLTIPTVDRAPHLYRVDPDHAAPGDDVVLRGANLMTGLAHPLAAVPGHSAIGAMAAAGVPSEATTPMIRGYVPADAQVVLGAGRAHPAQVLDWAADRIIVRIPDDAPVGVTTLTVWIHDDAVGPLAFTVVDRKDPRYHNPDSVVLDPDDRAYLDALLGEIKAVAKRDQVPELEDFAKQVEQLLQDAELGKISKEKLLEALAKAEAKLDQHAEPNQADIDKQLAELGKQLAKDQLTKDLGDALQKTDLDRAQKEMEKLAEKLDKNQLSEKDKEQLGKQLEKAAKQLEDKQKQQDQQKQAQKQKLEEQIRRLEKKKQEAKTDKDKLDAERQLAKDKEELKKLDKDNDQDNAESAQRQALKRLSKDLEKAAQDLQKKDQKGQQDPDKQEQQGQQASQKLKDAARETGRVDQDRRKQQTQKKLSSQMEDLREAMRRAKQKGNKDGKDPFGKQNKNQDFAQRARGQRGQSSAWKPGQGQQPGQGGQGQGGQGQGQGSQGGKEWGVGHDDNLVGDPTQKSGNTKDDDLQGKQGTQGGGTRETILAAAQKGFANQRYRDVYGKYHQIVEEVMRTEKLPSSYKYYVKRYFAKIHPEAAEPKGPAPAASGDSAGTPEDKP